MVGAALTVEVASVAPPSAAGMRRGRREPGFTHPDPAELAAMDALFKGFADPARLRILSALAAGPVCVTDLVEILGLPQPLVSRHLAYLRRAVLVRATRASRQQRYSLAAAAGAVHASLLACVQGCFTAVPTLARERAAATERAAPQFPPRPGGTRKGPDAA